MGLNKHQIKFIQLVCQEKSKNGFASVEERRVTQINKGRIGVQLKRVIGHKTFLHSGQFQYVGSVRNIEGVTYVRISKEIYYTATNLITE